MKNIHILPTENYSPLVHSTSRYGGFFKSEHYSPMKEMGDSYQHIYITSDEKIKEGDWFMDVDELEILKASENVELHLVNVLKPNYKKIILTTDPSLDGVQKIDDEFIEWFVNNPRCEEVVVKKGKMKLNDDGEEYGFPDMSLYKIIIPKEESKFGDSFENLANVMSTANFMFGVKEELKQIKCYCGHTTYCDCGPLEEPKDVVLGYKTSIVAQMLDRIDLEEPKQETLEEAAEKEAEGRYPVLTHSNPKNSPYVGTKQTFKHGVRFGAKWQQEQILQFLYSEITERRPYSSSKMCEKVIEFIEQLNTKK